MHGAGAPLAPSSIESAAYLPAGRGIVRGDWAPRDRDLAVASNGAVDDFGIGVHWGVLVGTSGRRAIERATIAAAPVLAKKI